MDASQIAGLIGTGVAAFVGWFVYQDEVKKRPYREEKLREKIRLEIVDLLPYQNGEREDVRRALSFLGNSSKSNRERIDAIEEDFRNMRREHNNLLDQTRDLQIGLKRLRDEQASP